MIICVQTFLHVHSSAGITCIFAKFLLGWSFAPKLYSLFSTFEHQMRRQLLIESIEMTDSSALALANKDSDSVEQRC